MLAVKQRIFASRQPSLGRLCLPGEIESIEDIDKQEIEEYKDCIKSKPGTGQAWFPIL